MLNSSIMFWIYASFYAFLALGFFNEWKKLRCSFKVSSGK
jgi:hypothetical protein